MRGCSLTACGLVGTTGRTRQQMFMTETVTHDVVCATRDGMEMGMECCRGVVLRRHDANAHRRLAGLPPLTARETSPLPPQPLVGWRIRMRPATLYKHRMGYEEEDTTTRCVEESI